MSYAALTDLAQAMPPDVLTRLASDDPMATAPDAAIVAAALAHADARIDAALASAGATLPEPPPAVIRHLAVQLARGWLYARRPEGMDYPEAIRREMEAAQKALDAIAAGRLRIGAAGHPSGTLEVVPGSRARDWGMLA